jgi:hypothetical protein
VNGAHIADSDEKTVSDSQARDAISRSILGLEHVAAPQAQSGDEADGESQGQEDRRSAERTAEEESDGCECHAGDEADDAADDKDNGPIADVSSASIDG